MSNNPNDKKKHRPPSSLPLDRDMDPWIGWARSCLILAIFILIGSGLYLNALDNPFVYDDDSTVVKNMNVWELKNIPGFFTDPHLSSNDPQIAGHYRPLVTSSYALNYAIGGLNPMIYRMVNIGFHAGSAFVVFLIVKAMLNNTLSALVAGMIFLVHPFNSEAVNYITARSSLMSGFFYLFAFYFWVRFREIKRGRRSFYIASLIAFLAGMLSKEVVVTLPLVLWLYDLYFYHSSSMKTLKRVAGVPSTIFNLRTYIPYLPFGLLVIIPYLLIRFFSLGKVLGKFQRDMITQILTEIPVLLKHWQMFLLPRGLSLVHDVEIYKELRGPVFLSGLLLILFIGGAIYFARLKSPSYRVASFFMFWFFIVLLPTTIIPLNAIFQENRGYMALVSFTVMAGAFIRETERKKGVRVLTVGFIILLFVAYSIVTVQRNMVWADEIRLWRDAIEKAPRSGVGYASLTAIYRDRGDFIRSIDMAREGLAINPNNYYIRFNLGRTYLLIGEEDRAIHEYEKALQIDPDRSIVWNELALLYAKKGDLERSEIYFREAIKRWDNLPPLYYNLGVILAARGKFTEGINLYKKAIILYPEYFRARYELANTLESLNRAGDARDEYREIVRLGSNELSPRAFMFGQDRLMVERIVEDARRRLIKDIWTQEDTGRQIF